MEDQAKSSSSNTAMWGAFLVLGLGYALLIAAPHVMEQLRTLRGTSPAAAGWLPAVAAAGLALGGGAAMVFVLARLVRDVERQPYACFAPVLSVFAGVVLAGLHVRLPLGSISSEYVGVFGIVLSAVGGALVQQPSWMVRVAGLLVALLGPVTLTGALWMTSKAGSLGEMLVSLDSQVRVFLMLLTVCSISMVVVALAARLMLRHRDASSELGADPAPSGDFLYGADPSAVPPAWGSFASSPRLAGPTAPAFDLTAEPWGAYADEPARAGSRSLWLWSAAGLLVVAGLVAAGYYAYFLPRQRAEAAQAAAAAAKVKAAAAAAEREGVVDTSSADAAARLKSLLDAQQSAVVAAPPPEQAPAEAAPTARVAESQGLKARSPAEGKVSPKRASAMAARKKRAARRLRARAARRARLEARASAAKQVEQAGAKPPARAAAKAQPRGRADSSSLALDAASRVGDKAKGSATPEQTLLDELSAGGPAGGSGADSDDPILGL